MASTSAPRGPARDAQFDAHCDSSVLCLCLIAHTELGQSWFVDCGDGVQADSRGDSGGLVSAYRACGGWVIARAERLALRCGGSDIEGLYREQARSYNFASALGGAVIQVPGEIVGTSLLAMRRGSAVGGMRLRWQWTIASKLALQRRGNYVDNVVILVAWMNSRRQARDRNSDANLRY